MKQLGYGNQPYFVYRNADIVRVHFHINGNPVRHPIKMSDIEESPRFYKEKAEKIADSKGYSSEKSHDDIKNRSENSRILFDLLRLVPDYLDKYRF